LRCHDPHDQKFLDLAFSAQAAVLLTEDEAPLALARKGRGFGLQISPREFGRRFG
jgi:predicted nucleic acid-binding protein